jgi:hypothetical protein
MEIEEINSELVCSKELLIGYVRLFSGFVPAGVSSKIT